MVVKIEKIDITDKFSASDYLLKCFLFFSIIAGLIGWMKYSDLQAKLDPETTRDRFFEEAQSFGTAVQRMQQKNFDLTTLKKNPDFYKKFAGFFELESICSNFTDPCLRNNMTYKTLDGEITPSYYKEPNIGQFITRSGALYMLYSYDENDLRIFVDINGISKKPNRFGADVFAFYVDNTGDVKYMGAAGTPYQNMNLYCNPYTSNKFNGLSCPYKAVLDRNYFIDTFKVIY